MEHCPFSTDQQQPICGVLSRWRTYSSTVRPPTTTAADKDSHTSLSDADAERTVVEADTSLTDLPPENVLTLLEYCDAPSLGSIRLVGGC